MNVKSLENLEGISKSPCEELLTSYEAVYISILMLYISPTPANETISEEIGDYYPVCCDAFARSAQSAETL